MMEPVPILTVGDLKSELSRWSNETPVTFYSPLKEQEFRFYRYQSVSFKAPRAGLLFIPY
jgi:hypothetical protein